MASTRKSFGRILVDAIDSPWASLVRGSILLVTAGFEAFETGFEQAIGHDIGLLHGFLALGVIEVLRGLPDIIEGARNVQSGKAGKRSDD